MNKNPRFSLKSFKSTISFRILSETSRKFLQQDGSASSLLFVATLTMLPLNVCTFTVSSLFSVDLGLNVHKRVFMSINKYCEKSRLAYRSFLTVVLGTGRKKAPIRQHCSKMAPNKTITYFQFIMLNKYSMKGAKANAPTPFQNLR